MSATFRRSPAVHVVCGVLLCSVATACDVGPTWPNQNWGFGACSSGAYAVSSIEFVPNDTLRVRVGEQDSVEVRARDAAGAFGELCGPRIGASAVATDIATVSGSGGGVARIFVRGVAPGSTVIHAVAGGRRDSLAVIVRP
jgi:hypothetical protein